MQKTKSKITSKDMVKALRAKHELALWKVEQLWNKMGEHDYEVRKNLVKAAMGLVEIEQEINVLSQLKVKKS